MAQPFAVPYSYFADANGIPLAGGKVYTYAAGTNTPQATYTDSTGTTPLSNPVILDSAGRATIWASGYYKIIVKDSLDNTIWTVDNVTFISGAGDMTKAVYDPANINEQLVGLTAVQNLTNKTFPTQAVNTNNTAPATTAFVYAALRGALFNTQSTMLTTAFTATSVHPTWTTVTGLSTTITPTSTTSTVLVRLALQVSNTATSQPIGQVLRNGTPIGIATSVGSRTPAGFGWASNNGNQQQGVSYEILDTPATTSAVTYTVQITNAPTSSGTLSVNATVTDTNTSGFTRTTSTITASEVHV